jgi:hypothetical protein
MSTNRHNFIPRNDEAFDTYYRNLVDYVIDNVAHWGHIRQDDVDALEQQFDEAFDIALEATNPLPPASIVN